LQMDKKKIREFLNNIYHPYRIVVYNDHLEERANFRLTVINLIFFFSVLISITFILAYLLIAFTPIRVTIPGIGATNSVENEQYIKLEQRTDSLEKAIQDRELELKSLKKMLKGDSLTSMHIYSLPANAKNIFKLTGFSNEGTTKSDSGSKKQVYFPPARGYISDHFSPSSGHYAIDIVTSKNAPVKATLDGYVIFAEWSASTGNVIILQHPDNLLSVYKHNSVLLKKVGNFVRSGEAIALVGNSGELTSGPHLHFELWQDGNPLNPEEFVSF
jgi:murein DD-endopeptidase MepM/ murein hydrolase activator NlpD